MSTADTLPANLQADLTAYFTDQGYDQDRVTRSVDQTLTWASDLLTGRVFQLAANSANSVIGYRPAVTTRSWGRVCETTGRMAAANGDAVATVASQILGRLNLWGTDFQVEASWWQHAADAIAAGFDDVHGQTGPEPCRFSDAQRPYTLTQCLLVYVWGKAATSHLSLGTLPDLGWCAAAMVAVMRVRVPSELSR
jgi:hypothetical protein